MKTSIHWTGLFFGAAVIVLGCGARDSSQTEEAAGNASGDRAIATTQQAVSLGWTGYTSDEYPPIVCGGSSLVHQFQCTGPYCDNIAAYCQPSGGTPLDSYWTDYFSEEGANSRFCNFGDWVTGFACSGPYCDRVSLECTSFINVHGPTNCHWVGPVSEENGGILQFGSTFYATGARCEGAYCDNMWFWVCEPS